MTAAPVYEIRCDCKGCPGCEGDRSHYLDGHGCVAAITDYGTATRVREMCRRIGWRTNLPSGMDRCDDCTKGRKP